MQIFGNLSNLNPKYIFLELVSVLTETFSKLSDILNQKVANKCKQL